MTILPSVSVAAICPIVVAVVSHNAEKIMSTGAIVFVVVIWLWQRFWELSSPYGITFLVRFWRIFTAVGQIKKTDEYNIRMSLVLAESKTFCFLCFVRLKNFPVCDMIGGMEEERMNSIVSFDLDMTLLDHRIYKIPDSAMETIEKLRDNHYIVLATGRDMDNYYSRQFRDIVKADAIIHNNGTRVTVGDKVIYETCMSKELVERVLRFAEGEGLAVGVTLGDDDYYTHPEAVIAHDKRLWGESSRRYQDPWKLLEKNIRTLAYVGDPEGAGKLEAAFPELKCPLFGGGKGADVLERKNSKANGLRILCEYWGIDRKDTYAFGDSMNDIEIIKAAGVGVAVGNAVDALKEVADYVAADIKDDGIYKACKHLGLIEKEEFRKGVEA